jgi:tetratricopeptide (TPR) repeat protein
MIRRRLLLLALVLQVVWLGLHVRRSVGLWEAERILKSVEMSTAQALATRRAAPGLLQQNAERLARAELLAPASASIRLARGAQFLLLGMNDKAIAAYEEALRLEPRPEIYLNLGRAQWRARQETAALESLRRALRLDPALLREIPPPAAARLLEEAPGPGTLDGEDPGASESPAKELEFHD